MKTPKLFPFLVVGKATSKFTVCFGLGFFSTLLTNWKKCCLVFTSNSGERKVGQNRRQPWNTCHDREKLESSKILNCRSVREADSIFHSWSQMLVAHFLADLGFAQRCSANRLWSMLIKGNIKQFTAPWCQALDWGSTVKTVCFPKTPSIPGTITSLKC